MPVGDFRDGVDVRNITVGIAQGLQIDRPGIILNGRLNLLQIMRIHECRGDAVLGKRVGKQVKTAAVDCLLGDNMAAVRRKCLDRIGDGRRARSHCQGCASALQGSKSLFQNILGGICQPSINITGISQTESVCSMLTVVEHIGSCLINRHRSGICCGIRLLLTYMQLKCFKFIITHFYCSPVHIFTSSFSNPFLSRE